MKNVAVTVIVGFITGLVISGILFDVIKYVGKSFNRVSVSWNISKAEKAYSEGRFSDSVLIYKKVLPKISEDNKVLLAKTKNNLAKVNSRLNSNNHEPKEKLKKLSKSHLNLYDAPSSKSSLNLLNNLPTTLITKAKLAKTKSQYETNNDSNFHKKTKMQQTKNNFLKLITKVNEGNSVKEYNNSKYSLLYNKNIYDVYEGDSLEKVEQRLKSKIMNMEKEAEFMEFEIGPLDISINRINFKKKKRKIGSKRTKDFDKKKYERNKKFINTAAIQKKQMLSQITSSNSYNVNSENILMTRSNQYLDDSSSKLNVNDKNNISSNVNFSGKFKLSSAGKMKSKYKSEKASNNYASNNISSKINSNNINSKINIHDKLTKIFKTKELKLDLPNKETILSKSKTYSNLDSKIGQTVIDNTGSIDEINGLSSEKEVFIIDKEKFRVLVHKKLVYDSLDDEELIEDAVVENFYFGPNSYTVIVVDAMVLILTFWSLIYKPLYLVLNNCDVKNTITSLTFNNISNIFIDALFIFDLIINFFKSYYNFEEQLVTKSNQIFFHYIKGFFFVDLISAIPYYSIIKFIALNRYQKYGISPNCSEFYNHQINDGFQVIEILKLFKILKCISRTNIVTNYILNELNSYTFFENWSFLIFNSCFFLLLLHLTACIHIFISCTAYPNWIVLKNLNFSSFPTIYLSSIYFLLTTVTSVGYGDIIGSTFTEFCFQIVILLVGIIAYSWLISSISNYVKEKNKQNEIFLQKISMLNEIKLEHPNMTKELYDKIYLHLEYINLKQKKDKSALIDSLPQTVTKSLLYEMYRPIIENFNFFKNFKNSEFINRVISKLKPIIAVKNDLLLDQGEIFEETFFVKQGRLSLEVKIDTVHPEKSVQKLLEVFGSAENVWRAELPELIKAKLNPRAAENLVEFRTKYPDAVEKLIEFCNVKKVKLCTFFDKDYPPILKEISGSPVIFYYRGELKPNAERISIVGTRNYSNYGERVTTMLGEELAAAGFTIVSGAARGIDTIAHKAALKTGRTVAVLGYGVNKIPRENLKFFEKIIENGGVIMSEFPPNMDGDKGTFPARNRIIAGLSRGLIVVEAGEKSGALITSGFAADNSRDVFVVPHNIFSPSGAGCNNLIREGALLIKSTQDILEYYNFKEKKSAPKIELDALEKIIYDAIPRDDFITLDEILMSVDEVSPDEISEIVLKLEMKGYILQKDDSYSR